MRFSLKNPPKKQLSELFIIVAIILSMAAMIFGFLKTEYSYKMYENSTVHYIRGVVSEVCDQSITVSGANKEFVTGNQKIKVEIKQGDLKGQTVRIDNYITVQHNVVVSKGSRVIVCADTPENAEPYYTLYNYDRASGIWILGIVFILLVIIVGEKNGFMSCIGLGFTLCAVVCWLLPALYNGGNAVLNSIIVVVFSTAVSCFCIGGISKKTALNIISTALGCLSAGIIYKLFSFALNINGTSADEIESLSLISQSTGLSLGGLLFAGILISSLGAIMDVGVSIGAALYEIKSLNADITSKELFRSGMNIGKDMIGTMTNTLILAFTGGSIATLMVLISYGVQYNQLLSSNYIALEVAKGLAGSAAVVLTVPISAAVCAFGYGKLKKQSFKEEK